MWLASCTEPTNKDTSVAQNDHNGASVPERRLVVTSDQKPSHKLSGDNTYAGDPLEEWMPCASSFSACAPAPHLQQKTLSCANSSPSTANETSSRSEPPLRPASP